MEDLLKKLDEIMTKDIFRKIGGLFCFVVVILSLAAFFVGTGSLINSMKKTEAVVESSEEEATEEADEEEVEETDEEATEGEDEE